MLVFEAVDEFLAGSRALLAEDDEKLKQLIIKAAEGDNAAFTSIYNKFSRVALGVARSKAKGAAKSDVEDIVQTTFVKFLGGEMKKFAAKLKAGQRKARDFKPLLISIVKHAVIDANKAAGRKGMTHRRIHDVEPSDSPTGSEKHLGLKSKRTIRLAFNRALAKAKLTPTERVFIGMLFRGTEPGMGWDVPGHGQIAQIAKKAGLGKGQPTKQIAGLGTKAKKKFLKTFCNDKDLCALLPRFKGRMGRARTKGVKIPGLGANVCKDVPTCTEEFVVALYEMDDAEWLDEDTACDLLLPWIWSVLL